MTHDTSTPSSNPVPIDSTTTSSTTAQPAPTFDSTPANSAGALTGTTGLSAAGNSFSSGSDVGGVTNATGTLELDPPFVPSSFDGDAASAVRIRDMNSSAASAMAADSAATESNAAHSETPPPVAPSNAVPVPADEPTKEVDATAAADAAINATTFDWSFGLPESCRGKKLPDCNPANYFIEYLEYARKADMKAQREGRVATVNDVWNWAGDHGYGSAGRSLFPPARPPVKSFCQVWKYYTKWKDIGNQVGTFSMAEHHKNPDTSMRTMVMDDFFD